MKYIIVCLHLDQGKGQHYSVGGRGNILVSQGKLQHHLNNTTQSLSFNVKFQMFIKSVVITFGMLLPHAVDWVLDITTMLLFGHLTEV